MTSYVFGDVRFIPIQAKVKLVIIIMIIIIIR